MPTVHETVPEHLRTDFDIFDESIAQPVDRVQEILAKMATVSPVMHSSKYGGHWVVLGYEEVHEVLRDPSTYSSWPNNMVPHGAGQVPAAGAGPAGAHRLPARAAAAVQPQADEGPGAEHPQHRERADRRLRRPRVGRVRL